MPSPPCLVATVERVSSAAHTSTSMPAPRITVVTGERRRDFGHRIPRRDGGPDDGIHAAWAVYDDHVELTGDRYGFQPLFYWCDETRFVASPSLVALATHLPRRDLDRTALATFWHLGYLVGEDTPLEGVRTLPPGARVSWNGTLQVATQRALGVANSDDFDTAVDRYIELFRASIKRRPPRGRFTVPLSGGRDSRHILFELAHQGHLPQRCVSSRSLPPVASVDAPAAQAVCERLGIAQDVVGPPSRYVAERRRTLRTSLCCDEHEWMIGMVDHLVGRYDTVWDGVSGDTLSAPRLQPPANLELFRAGRLEELADRILGRDIGPLLGALPSAFRPSGARERARERVTAELRHLDGAANPLALFNIYNRGRREIAMMSTAMLAGVPTAYCPFLDHDLFDYLAGLPFEVRSRPEFHDTAIARAYPQWSDVPYAPKNQTVSAAADFISLTCRASVEALGDDLRWAWRLPRLLGQWCRFGLSASARRGQRWLSPGRMLHAVMLERLRDDPAALLREQAQEPGMDFPAPAPAHAGEAIA